MKNLVMCVKAEDFLRIASLYPKTMEDLKVRGLERREFFLKTYRKAEARRKEQYLRHQRQTEETIFASARESSQQGMKLYNNIRVNKNDVGFDEDEIDESDFKAQEEI